MMIRAVLLTAAAISLSGCISLFPKADPVTLYKLQANTGAPSVEPTGAVILRSPTAFTRLGSGDRILTMNGAERATIAGARWAAPASVMFDEALISAFDTVSSRLVTRGDATPADQILRVEVRTFEARYVGGMGAAPAVVVEARATLTNMRDRTQAYTRAFKAEQPATDNRVGAIVDAYNGATSKVVTDIAQWAQSNAPTKR